MKTHLRNLLAAALTLLAVCSASAQPIIGAWSYGTNTANPSGTDSTGVIVFLANSTYFQIENNGNDGFDGFERGTYSWNGTNGAVFTTTQTRDTGGDTGLSDIAATTQLSISGNTLTLIDVDGIGTDDFELTRVAGSDALVGAWFTGSMSASGAGGESAMLVFLQNGAYFLAFNNPSVSDPNDEIEHGTYLWNSGTGAFSFTNSFVDQYIDSGLYSIGGQSLTTSFSITGTTLTGVDGYGPYTLTAVSAIPEPSTYAALAGLGALGLAAWRRRRIQAAA